MGNTTISGNGTFSTSQVAGASGDVIFINTTGASISGTVAITRTGLTPSPTFDLDLEAGESYVLRNTTAATTYTYAGEVTHTAVKRSLAHEYESRLVDMVDGTDQAGTALPLVIVSLIS